MVNTMLGEVVVVIGNCVYIDNGLMLSKEDFEIIKLPSLPACMVCRLKWWLSERMTLKQLLREQLRNWSRLSEPT